MRQHDFVLARDGDAAVGGPAQDVLARPVMLNLVEVGRDHVVEFGPEVGGHRVGLHEDLGQDDGGAQVDPDAGGHVGDDRAEFAEIQERGLADGGAVGLGVHVHGVGADGHVDGGGAVEAAGGGEDALVGVRKLLRVVVDEVADGLAEPAMPAQPRRRVHVAGRLLDHAEGAVAHGLGGVLARLAVIGEFQVVDGAGPVGGHGGDDAALHQVDDDGPQAALDDVAAEGDDDRGIGLDRRGDGPRQLPQAVGGGRVGQRLEEGGGIGLGGRRHGQVLQADLVPAVGDGDHAQFRKVDRLVGLAATHARSPKQIARRASPPANYDVFEFEPMAHRLTRRLTQALFALDDFERNFERDDLDRRRGALRCKKRTPFYKIFTRCHKHLGPGGRGGL